MLDASTFYARLEICKVCVFWRDRCLKGHAVQSAAGCPLRKFAPVKSAGYAKDIPVILEPDLTGNDCCGS